jgi:superfamily I DNA and/or RNA helicase
MPPPASPAGQVADAQASASPRRSGTADSDVVDDDDDAAPPDRTRRGFVSLGRRVVEAEHAAELSSLALARETPPQLDRMRLADTSGGVGGRVLLALAPMDGSRMALSGRELSAGDSVQVDPSGVRGVVWRITGEHVVVSVDAEALEGDGMDGRISVLKLASDVTYQRQVAALERLEGSFRHPVADAMFGVTSPSFDAALRAAAAAHVAASAEMYPDALNGEQREAVGAAVAANQLALVHGPPGTGKTATLAAAIQASVRVRGERVLACAPSNVAADTLLERLVALDGGLRVVRLGNPARLLESVLECSLDELLSEEHGSVGRQIQRDISVVQKVLWRRAPKAEKAEARGKLRLLQKEQQRREQEATMFILERADVVVCTCAGAFDRKLRGMRGAGVEEDTADARYPFDAVFIDEAANALEPTAWCAMLLGRRCVLAGDDKQLPPTLLTDDAVLRRAAVDLTAFGRARGALGGNVVLLRRQYRMHAVIGQFSSEAFYKRALVHDESCRERDVGGLVLGRLGADGGGGAAGIDFAADLTSALVFIDTAGCDFFESTEAGVVDGGPPSRAAAARGKRKKSGGDAAGLGGGKKSEDCGSRLNEGEAGLVLAHCRNLVEQCRVLPEEIACISPYSAQCRRVRALLDEAQLRAIEVGTVDGLQGREKEVIVFSATRSSELGGKSGIGFLGETRRFNVAVSFAPAGALRSGR